ncbi:MAG: DNA repair protein RadA [Phycisphaeraceae bacterium]
MVSMAKSHVSFICNSCGGVQARWMGKCPDCGGWDTLEEHRHAPGSESSLSTLTDTATTASAVPIGEVDQDSAGIDRLTTGIGELDRVLGGGATSSQTDSPIISRGFVPGSAVLIGGDPGIGKSTLMLQAAHQLALTGQRVLYVSSEESAQQLRLRASRLGINGTEQLYVLADTNLARIVEQVRRTEPRVLVIDSVQMIYKGDLSAAPGSVAQLRACCQDLVVLAKTSGIAVALVGHVTKQGQLAGPRLLEHMVDTVLYFEGDRYHSHRVIRAIKNRFGTTLEVGLFEMTDKGLSPVTDGSGLLAAEYQARPGSVVCPVLQGTRCLLVELQALTATGFLGSAKRKVSGVDGNRLAVLIAVLEKRAGLRLADQDVFVSGVGGVRVNEPAADLPLTLAIAGAHYNRQTEPGTCAVGEIGLGGEVRHVQQLNQRIAEAARLGFNRIICPPTDTRPPKGATLLTVKTLDEAIQLLA